MAKTTALFLSVAGVISLLATLVQINPIWLYGPYDPTEVSAGAQPDWYLGFLEGALRLMPSWEATVLASYLFEEYPLREFPGGVDREQSLDPSAVFGD